MNEPTNSSKKSAKIDPRAGGSTHGLTYDKQTDRWSCKCGYVLGVGGHHALYALCPLSFRDKSVSQQESLSPNADKLPPLKKTALDLFDLAP